MSSQIHCGQNQIHHSTMTDEHCWIYFWCGYDINAGAGIQGRRCCNFLSFVTGRLGLESAISGVLPYMIMNIVPDIIPYVIYDIAFDMPSKNCKFQTQNLRYWSQNLTFDMGYDFKFHNSRYVLLLKVCGLLYIKSTISKVWTCPTCQRSLMYKFHPYKLEM